MEITQVKTETLKPFDKNPMVHSDEQIKRIVRSIKEFGFTAPILALKNGNIIVAGHARLKAAKIIGMIEVPVVYLENMTFDQAKAYCIADNRLAQLAIFDNSLLLPLIEEIKLANLDTEITGFSMDEIIFLQKDELIPISEPEYDESIANDVKKTTCPNCGHEFPI